MGSEYVETVVVGAGQQGCAVAAALQELGRDAVVLERGEIGQAWAHERWDSLRVGSGNRTVLLPGWEYDGDDPDGHMSGPELARHLRRYVETRGLRVREHTAAGNVECLPDATGTSEVRFRTYPDSGDVLESRNLVAAVGGYACPRVPALASAVNPAVTQLHARDYRNPRSLPEGAVLVVGAGISGQQIADELLDAGRSVFFSVGRHRAWPSRYRGRGIHDWMAAFALYEEFVRASDAGGSDPSNLPGLPVCATQDWTEDLNLGTLSRKGAMLLGSVRTARHDVLGLEDNVDLVVAESSRSYRRVTTMIDDGIRQRGFPAPEHGSPSGIDPVRYEDFGAELDLTRRGVTTILWCTGFGPDYRILPSHVLDGHGAPIQEKGIFGVLPGLYYAGLPDGDSLHPTGIPAATENGRTIARLVHLDHTLRCPSDGLDRRMSGRSLRI